MDETTKYILEFIENKTKLDTKENESESSLIKINNTFDEKFIKDIKNKKKLKHENFLILKKIVKEENIFINFLERIIEKGITKDEAIVIGRALNQSKLIYSQKLIDFFVEKININIDFRTINGIFNILHFLLLKSLKVNISHLTKFLENYIQISLEKLKSKENKKEENQINCNLLKLILIIQKYYPIYMNSFIIEFCKNYDHEICREIIKNTKENNIEKINK